MKKPSKEDFMYKAIKEEHGNEAADFMLAFLNGNLEWGLRDNKDGTYSAIGSVKESSNEHRDNYSSE